MDCYNAASFGSGGSAFFQPKIGVSWPSIEVYVADCFSGVSLILTKIIQVSPGGSRLSIVCWTQFLRMKGLGRSTNMSMDLFHKKNYRPQTQSWMIMSQKEKTVFYSEDMYHGEDGQLSWFNAGVRVGVGTGLGMCVGVGIGVGLLMRTYQATTRNLRRRFF